MQLRRIGAWVGVDAFSARLKPCPTRRSRKARARSPFDSPSLHSGSLRASSRPAGESAGLRDDVQGKIGHPIFSGDVLSRSEGRGWAEDPSARCARSGFRLRAPAPPPRHAKIARVGDPGCAHARKAPQVAPHRRVSRDRYFFGTAKAVPYPVARAKRLTPTSGVPPP